MEYLNQPFKLKNISGCDPLITFILDQEGSKNESPHSEGQKTCGHCHRMGTRLDFKERKKCR